MHVCSKSHSALRLLVVCPTVAFLAATGALNTHISFQISIIRREQGQACQAESHHEDHSQGMLPKWQKKETEQGAHDVRC